METYLQVFFYLMTPFTLIVIAWKLQDIAIEMKYKNKLSEERNEKLLKG